MDLPIVLIASVLGGISSFIVLRVLHAYMRKMGGSTRDIVTFTRTESIWPALEQWAARFGYRVVHDEGTIKRYQKGSALNVPLMLEAAQQGDSCSLQAYAGHKLAARKPMVEMALTVPGIVIKFPRNKAKKEVNELLTTLGLEALA